LWNLTDQLKKLKKKFKSIRLTCQIHDIDNKTEITIKKKSKILNSKIREKHMDFFKNKAKIIIKEVIL